MEAAEVAARQLAEEDGDEARWRDYLGNRAHSLRTLSVAWSRFIVALHYRTPLGRLFRPVLKRFERADIDRY